MHDYVVGIVLVNYNGMRFMPDCLNSLEVLEYPSAKIVVIDNASTDGSAEWVEQNCPKVVLIRLENNTGITGGNNAGIEWSLANGCDYVLLLNNDTIVQPDFLTKMMEHAAPSVLVVPKIYFDDNRELINNHFGSFDHWRGIHVDWFYGRPDSARSNAVQVSDMANTCAMLIPRFIIEDIGLMDETYFIYSDDTDFITRAVRRGASVTFVPSAVIYHRESSSSGGTTSPLSVYYCNRNRLYFMRKHKQSNVTYAFFILYFWITRLAVSYLYWRSGKRQQQRALWNAVADFYGNKMGHAPVTRFNG